MALHAIGAKLEDGRTCLFIGTYTDEEFHANFPALPAGWLAWHIEESELNEPVSQRVKDLRALPRASDYDRLAVMRGVALGLTPEEFFRRRGI